MKIYVTTVDLTGLYRLRHSPTEKHQYHVWYQITKAEGHLVSHSVKIFGEMPNYLRVVGLW